MASRSAKSPKRRKKQERYDDESGLGAFLSRHRFAVGGVTAFAVAFSYVAANAIWYQPHAHGGAFFQTRPINPNLAGPNDVAQDDGETIFRIERPEAEGTRTAALETATPPVPQPSAERMGSVPVPSPAGQQPAPSGQPAAKGSPVVQEVQTILADLNLYTGETDGLTGPQTRAAIENYRRIVGLPSSGEIDDQLLRQLGATSRVTASAAPAAPTPVPAPAPAPGTDMMATASSGAPARQGDPMVMRIQAGLKAFGNDGIEVDGVVGSRTKSAILEFQSLFGLPETGEPDQTVYAKMREIGLTN